MNKPTLEEQNAEIRAELAELADHMVSKNNAHGGAALAPMGVVTKGHPLDIIFARIDDCFSCILRGEVGSEDPWQDLRGYITLWQIAKRFEAKGFYQEGTGPVLKADDDSGMPMPIGARCEDTEAWLDEGATDMHPEQDPIDLSVVDIASLANQEIKSVIPDVPDVEDVEEVSDPTAGQNPKAEVDPWDALGRPTKLPDAMPLSPPTAIDDSQ